LTYDGDTDKEGAAINTVLIFSAASPRFRSAVRVKNPQGCSYKVSAWTPAGLFGSQLCAHPYSETGTALVEFSQAGRLIRKWTLSPCTTEAYAHPDKTLSSFVVSAAFGFGEHHPCDEHWGEDTFELSGDKLRLISHQDAGFQGVNPVVVPIAW
jgi:hypothetical protein